jgi:hypothetical protein
VRIRFHRPAVNGLKQVPWSWVFLAQMTWTVVEFSDRVLKEDPSPR